ncbi:type VII secretion-associated protein [Pseudonocardia sp. CA-107938]|uniref:type VII secretion-associated protein n=1 Tax=Pseudonocardia sp. CA-107938 TaxID=3240021 RepID=UPI003D8ACA09
MTDVPGVRIAVQVGSANVRIAVAGPRSAAQLVAEVPREGFAGLADAVATWAGPRPAELVLVHAATAPAAEVAAEVAAAAPLAAVVRAVPAPVAAAAGTDAVAVLDAGHSGIEITVLGHGSQRVPGGGAAVAVPAAVRERLSLLPAVGSLTAAAIAPLLADAFRAPVAALRAALDGAGVTGPVLLVGGLARTPALAELVDAAGVRAARVPARPEAAAVLGALRAPTTSEPLPEPPRTWLPPARPPAPRRRFAVALAAVPTAAALLAAGRLVPAPAAVDPAPGVVQYGYRAALPDGWAHTGGRPERRRTLLTPVGAPEGSDLVAIEASPLGYDPVAEPERAARELRAVHDAGLAGGAQLEGYDPAATYAGRAVTAYRQHRPDGLVVDWYVLFEHDTQLSVGCQHTAAGATSVATACAAVVGTLHRT